MFSKIATRNKMHLIQDKSQFWTDHKCQMSLNHFIYDITFYWLFVHLPGVWWRRETTLIQAKKKKKWKWYPKKGKCAKAYLAQLYLCHRSDCTQLLAQRNLFCDGFRPPLCTAIDLAACTYRYLCMCCTLEAALYHTWFLFSSPGNYGYAHSFCNCSRVKISHSKIDRHTHAHTIQLPILIWLENM